MEKEPFFYEGEIFIDGYPTDEYLKWIEEYDFTKYCLRSFLHAIFEGWNHGTLGYRVHRTHKGYRKLELHTLGWSGNESIIQAIEDNRFFFLVYWYKTERGGHYYFNIPVKDWK